jgi:hypothetical protein
MKKIKVPSNVTVSGPFFTFSSPYGIAMLERDVWYVSKTLAPKERKTEFQKILGATCLGSIIKFKGSREYVIDQAYPRQAFSSLQKSVDFLIGS